MVEAGGRIYFVQSTGNYSNWPYLDVMKGKLNTRTGDIFVDTSVADELYIRWEAKNNYLAGILRFAVLLRADGSIRFDYGDGNEFDVGDPNSISHWNPSVGIFSMNGYNEIGVDGYDGADSLTNAPSILFSLVDGIVDIGAYEFKGNSLDNLAPVPLSISFN